MELPTKKAVLDTDMPGMGLKAISLVSDPAIQITWFKFENDQPVKLAIQNEDKRIIFTPVLIPNQKIYRNINGEEFNLLFDADTIEDIALKWQRDNLSSATDINHSQKLIPGVTFFETTIKNPDRNSTQRGFEKLPDGTWFLTGKVDDDAVWSQIKAGSLTGVSIDGLFKTMNVQAEVNIKYAEVKVANDNSLFVDGPIALGTFVYYNKPELVIINGVKSEIKRLVWDNQIVLEDGTALTLANGEITSIAAIKVQAMCDNKLKEILYNL